MHYDCVPHMGAFKWQPRAEAVCNAYPFCIADQSLYSLIVSLKNERIISYIHILPNEMVQCKQYPKAEQKMIWLKI